MSEPSNNQLTTRSSQATVLCLVLGGLGFVVGMYYMLNSHNMGYGAQKLAMGQAFVISGAVFLAAALRPR